MREQFGRAGRLLLAWLLSPFRLVLRILRQPWQWLQTVTRWVWTGLSSIILRFWRFIGRLGLATRNLLRWFIWEPLLLLLTPLQRPARWLWRFWGRMGLALRHLLTWFIWRPGRALLLPVRWLYRLTLRPLLQRLIAAIQSFIRPRWAARRRLYRQRLASRWLVLRTRWYVAVKRPKSPGTAAIAPRVPRTVPPNTRLLRLATAFTTVGIALAVSLVTFQDRQPGRVAADVGSLLPRIIVITPSPAPATPTPAPTIEVILTPWPTPDPLNKGGTLAFTWRQHGNSDIYILPIGQAEPLRLTTHPADDSEPVWRQDGQELAFTSHRDGNWDIYIYNLAAGTLHRITNDPAYEGRPSWSPDGQWLVYESYRDNNLDIYIAKADLSEGPYRLTENPAPDFAPVWSPGGRHIAFTSWRSGNKDIFIMPLDAASDETAVNLTASPANHEDNPDFSPDGRYLAYDEEGSGFPLIYALPLTAHYTAAGPPIGLGQQGYHPTWSPDSSALLYVHNKGDKGHLLAGSPAAWGVAPQAYAADGRLDTPSWVAVTLTPELLGNLKPVDPARADRPLFVEALAPPAASGPPVLLQELPVNAPSPYLSDRVDASFLALRERVSQATGWDFLGQLDNMFEAIDSRPLPGQANHTWNKAGRAFDLYYREALAFEPRVEIVRQEQGAETYWRVYIKTAAQDGSQGAPLRELPWDFRARYGDEPHYYDQGGKVKDAIPPGYYVDFTALAADYGWTWTPAAENWHTYFPGIRFWHYENQQGLTWEQAMLELYPAEELADIVEGP